MAAVIAAAVVTTIAYLSAPAPKSVDARRAPASGSAVSAGQVTEPPSTAAPAFVPTSGAVEWVATPPATPAAPAAPSAPPGTPPCTAFQLQARGGWQGAGGTMLGGISFTNISGNPCSIHGVPDVRLTDNRGFRIDLSERASTTVDPGPALLAPGVADAVSIGVQWANWCGPLATPVTVRVSLPDGGNVVGVQPSRDTGFQGVPRCDNAAAGSSLTVDPAQAPAAPQAPPPSAALTATLRTPESVAAGATLEYEVTLTNPTAAPVPLSPCPSYTEALGPVQAAFSLNCAPVPPIQPGASVTFAMRLDIPAGTPAGPATLQWQAGGPAASVPVSIT